MAHGTRAAGIYVHFPFCLRKCPYCDFASIASPRESIPQRAYTRAILREATLRAAAMTERLSFTSIYVGGGTPSLWEPACVQELLAGIGGSFGVGGGAEITIECNPSSLDRTSAAAFAAAGVTRMSVGTQSVHDGNLMMLGRLHDAQTGLEAVRAALDSGVARVSADLIMGLPGQSAQAAARDAAALASTGVGHVSAYLLSIEEGTPFWRAREAGELTEVEEGVGAEAYLAVSDELEALGYEHYEVSSHARHGQRSVHNTAVWAGGSYVGLGAGAVGFMRSGEDRHVRYRNDPEPRGYVRAVGERTAIVWEGETGPVQSVELVDRQTRLRERVMLGLRVAEGVDFAALGEEFGEEVWTARRQRSAGWLAARGRVQVEGARVRIPRRAWLWESDTIARLL